MTEGRPAPRAFVDARVYTQDRELPWCDGLLVEDGRIARLLRRGETLPAEVRALDLGGRLVLPGFVDAHTHLLQYATNLDDITLAAVATLDEALERVADVAAKSPSALIRGQGWDPHAWGGFPNRSHLDRVAPGRAVVHPQPGL